MPQEAGIKSTHRDMPSFVSYVNRTSEPVDVIWRDYQGRCVRYRQGLLPGTPYHMNTFVSHPWQAWSTEDHSELCIGGSRVYMPEAAREPRRTLVYIDRPMLPLLDICARQIRKLVKTEEVDSLEIPKFLQDKLKDVKQRQVFKDVH